MQRRSFVWWFLIIILLTGCAGPTPTGPGLAPVTSGRALVVGLVSNDLAGARGRAQPLADYLAGGLADQGITAGEVWIASSKEEMAGWLESGEVDLYFDSFYSAAWVCENSGAEPVLRGWQFRTPESHAVIFASRSSGLSSLADLPGRLLVLNSAESTTGFLLPATFLSEKGLALAGKGTADVLVAPAEVGFVFSGSDEATLQMVLSGAAAAGAVDDYYFDLAFPPEATEKLVELARTEKIPRQVVVLRSGLETQLRAALLKTLTTMHETETGQAALEVFQSSQFEAFPNADEISQRMQVMLATVENIPLP